MTTRLSPVRDQTVSSPSVSLHVYQQKSNLHVQKCKNVKMLVDTASRMLGSA
jgi:hypothetical protein